jgi:hypothetical protein
MAMEQAHSTLAHVVRGISVYTYHDMVLVIRVSNEQTSREWPSSTTLGRLVTSELSEESGCNTNVLMVATRSTAAVVVVVVVVVRPSGGGQILRTGARMIFPWCCMIRSGMTISVAEDASRRGSKAFVGGELLTSRVGGVTVVVVVVDRVETRYAITPANNKHTVTVITITTKHIPQPNTRTLVLKALAVARGLEFAPSSSGRTLDCVKCA